MSQATRLIVLLAAAAIGLAGTPAAAQSEDERIMREGSTPVGGTDTPPPETEEEELDEQVFYSGMGISQVETDFGNLGKAFNLDVTLGFRIPTVKWLGLEIDIGQTVIPGEYREPRSAQPAQPIGCGTVLNPCTTPAQPAEEGADDPEQDEFAMQALGIGLAFKSTGRFYVLGKYGYRYMNTSNETINEGDRSSQGFGAGVGYRWGKGLSGVELTYKELGESVDQIGLTFFARLNRR
jgi:hypothetical protein